MRAPKLTEAQLHKAVAGFLDAALPMGRCVWTTFPAGGGGKVRGAKLKAAGLRKGWPDVQIVWRVPDSMLRDRCYFIGIELKTETGIVDADQQRCHAAIRKAGGYVFVCRSLDEVEGCLQGFGIPLRATLNAGHGWSKAA